MFSDKMFPDDTNGDECSIMNYFTNEMFTLEVTRNGCCTPRTRRGCTHACGPVCVALNIHEAVYTCMVRCCHFEVGHLIEWKMQAVVSRRRCYFGVIRVRLIR